MGLENSVLNRGVSLLEGFILTEIKALVTESAILIRGVSCKKGCPQIGVSLYIVIFSSEMVRNYTRKSGSRLYLL